MPIPPHDPIAPPLPPLPVPELAPLLLPELAPLLLPELPEWIRAELEGWIVHVSATVPSTFQTVRLVLLRADHVAAKLPDESVSVAPPLQASDTLSPLPVKTHRPSGLGDALPGVTSPVVGSTQLAAPEHARPHVAPTTTVDEDEQAVAATNAATTSNDAPAYRCMALEPSPELPNGTRGRSLKDRRTRALRAARRR